MVRLGFFSVSSYLDPDISYSLLASYSSFELLDLQITSRDQAKRCRNSLLSRTSLPPFGKQALAAVAWEEAGCLVGCTLQCAVAASYPEDKGGFSLE